MSDKTLTVEISGTNCKLTTKDQDYIDKKCRKLVNHLSSRLKNGAFISVKVTKLDAKEGDHFQIDAVLTMPDKTLVASEAAATLSAAIDIVENKLQGQIRKYKTKSVDSKRGGIIAALKRSLRR